MGWGILALVGLSATSASTFTITRILVRYVPPFFLVSIRLLFAGLLFFCWAPRKTATVLRQLSFLEWLKLMYAALISLYGSLLLEAAALQIMTSAKVAFFYNLSPVLALLLAYVTGSGRVTRLRVIAVILGSLACLPLLIADAPQEGATWLYLSLPEFIMIVAVICYTYGWHLLQGLIQAERLPASSINFVAMTNAGCAALVTSFFCERHFYAAWTSHFASFSWLQLAQCVSLFAGLVLIGTVLCYALYFKVLRYHSTAYVTLAELLTPFFTAIYSWFAIGEPITTSFIISSVVVIGAVLTFYYDEIRP